jgi:hypothetical protein
VGRGALPEHRAQRPSWTLRTTPNHHQPPPWAAGGPWATIVRLLHRLIAFLLRTEHTGVGCCSTTQGSDQLVRRKWRCFGEVHAI